jgi:MFS family permease
MCPPVIGYGLLTLVQLPLSRTLDRFRPGPVLALGGMTYLALYAAAITAPSAPEAVRLCRLITAMAVYTLGEVAVSQAGLVMLTALPPKQGQGTYMAFNQAFVGTATALAPLLATSMLDSWAPGLWWILCLISVLAALFSTWQRPPGHAPA